MTVMLLNRMAINLNPSELSGMVQKVHPLKIFSKIHSSNERDYKSTNTITFQTWNKVLPSLAKQPLLWTGATMINDVNSNRRGRDYFMLLSNMLTSSGINNIAHKRYFNYGIKNDYMRYGTVYPTINILYDNINKIYNPITLGKYVLAHN